MGATEGDYVHITIGIATRGRAEVLGRVLRALSRQTRAPDDVIVCATSPDDVGRLPQTETGIRWTFAPPGLPGQRNVIMRAAPTTDVLVFLDDDFLMSPAYLRVTEQTLQDNPGICGTTGDLLHDDARGPGMTVEAAEAMIEGVQAADGLPGFTPAPHLYGCNMALRMATVRAHCLTFDERLPLYGWSEDIDFTHRLKRHGVLAKLHGARGVHLGVKTGRTPGYRLGYSQVANPIYLFAKGSYSAGRAWRSVLRNLAANAGRAAWPEPWVDRRGRLRGNLRALAELCTGRLAPERVLDL